MITVKELARELNISVQAVYKMLKKEKYKKYISVVDGKKLIKKEILEEINKTDKNINGVQIYADDMQKALFKQLEIKDKQIEQLTNRISELNALMLNNQLMLNNLQEQIKQLNAPKEPPQEPESKKNIWKIFKRKHSHYPAAGI